MIIEIDLESKLPPYVQIKQSIIELIALGTIERGAKLPPIRQVAGDLGVAINTVARAYRELESDGLVRSNGRRGTVVTRRPDPKPVAEVVQREVDELVRITRDRGLDAATVLGLVTKALATD